MNIYKNEKIFILISIVIIFVGIVFAFFTPQTKEKRFIDKVIVNLTKEQRDRINQDINKYQDMLTKGDTGGENDMMLVHLALGLNYELLGELEMARQSYLKATEVNPKSGIPWSNLGTLYQSMGNDKLALESLERALQLDPATVIFWEKRIDLAIKLKDSKNTVEKLFEQSLKSTGDDFRLMRKYAVFLESVEDFSTALEKWNFLVKANIDDEFAKSEVKRLKSVIYNLENR